MASKSQKCEKKRLHKTRKVGKDRKKKINRDGTTVPFAIHLESTQTK